MQKVEQFFRRIARDFEFYERMERVDQLTRANEYLAGQYRSDMTRDEAECNLDARATLIRIRVETMNDIAKRFPEAGRGE